MARTLVQGSPAATAATDFASKYGVEPLTDKACNVLRHAILSGRFPPGTQLKELAICEMFGLSRTPVRHAFSKLTSLGLVEQIPNVGSFVRKLALGEEIEIMEARRTMEAAAAALAAEKASSEDKAGLIELAKDAETQRETGTNEDILESELLFHREVMRICGNREVVRLAGSLHAIFQTLTGSGKAIRTPNKVNHVDVAQAVAAGEPIQAFTAMWRHLSMSLDEWRKRISAQPNLR